MITSRYISLCEANLHLQLTPDDVFKQSLAFEAILKYTFNRHEETHGINLANGVKRC